MTRQKREILRRIDEIQAFIDVDRELGCGFAPPHAYDPLYRQIDALLAELARLRKYESVQAMLMDTRGCREAYPFL